MQDAKRGYDHGHFIPLMLLYPAADIPTVQLSLVAGLDPEVRCAVLCCALPLAERPLPALPNLHIPPSAHSVLPPPSKAPLRSSAGRSQR